MEEGGGKMEEGGGRRSFSIFSSKCLLFGLHVLGIYSSETFETRVC